MTTDLKSVRNKLDFARSTNLPGALDGRLTADVRTFGLDALVLEVLDVLEVTPGMTPADLRALAELWREKLGDVLRH